MNDVRDLSLGDLADLADVTPRTVRYYIAQGLLPPPTGSGPASRYSTVHLDRLRLIRELQRQHLPLAEIRNRLDRLSEEEVATLARAATQRPGPAPESALDYIRSILSGAASPLPPVADPSPSAPPWAGRAPQAPGQTPIPPPARAAATPARAGVSEAAAAYAEAAARRGAASGGGVRSQWERIALAPDIELHVRRPLSRLQNRAVERLVAVARELLEEDPS